MNEDIADEEMELMSEKPQEKGACGKASWALALLVLVGGAAVAGMAFFSSHSPAPLGKMEPKFIQESRQSSMTTGDLTNSGQVAAGNIHNGDTHNGDIHNGDTYINYGSHAPQGSECHVRSDTNHKVQFRDEGTYIVYSIPGLNEGKFFKNWKPITDVKDLPRCLTELWLVDEDLGGDVSQLPRGLTSLGLSGRAFGLHQVQLTGDLKQLPPSLEVLDLCDTSRNLTGDVKDLPRSLVHVDLKSAKKVTGNLDGLPPTLTFADFASATKISGSIWDLPKSLTFADFHDATQLYGNIKDLPPHMSIVYLSHSKSIRGSLSDAPNLQCERSDPRFGGGGGVRCFRPPNLWERIEEARDKVDHELGSIIHKSLPFLQR